MLLENNLSVTISVIYHIRYNTSESALSSGIESAGGFFASGFKRAFKVKDFGDSIPGHGGVTDRCDCQMLMAVFSYLWYNNIIRVAEVSVAEVIDMVGHAP